MGATLTIAVRDFRGFFGTAAGWVAATFVFLAAGIVFFIVTQDLLNAGQATDPVSVILGNMFGFLNYIYIFVVPVFALKAITDDFATGSYRLQAVAPVSTWEVVFGKFFGIMFYFGVLALLMLIYPLFVALFASPDWTVMLVGWGGSVLHVAALVSITLFISSLTKNSVISYLGSALFILVVLLSSYFKVLPEWYTKSVNLLEMSQQFTKGIINTQTLAVYLVVCGIFLFLTRLVLESKKWRF